MSQMVSDFSQFEIFGKNKTLFGHAFIISFQVLSVSVFNTVQILCIGTDRSQQTVQTKIRLLLKKQSDQGLCYLPFHQHLLDAMLHQTFLFLDNYGSCLRCPKF